LILPSNAYKKPRSFSHYHGDHFREWNKRYTYLIIVLLVIACLAAYGRILGNDFVNLWLITDWLLENNYVQNRIFDAKSVKWALTNASLEYGIPWPGYPSCWSGACSGRMLPFIICQPAFAYWRVLFLFLFLNKQRNVLWPSAFVGRLFLLASVCGSSLSPGPPSIRCLSMFFGMATLYAYAQYVEKIPYIKVHHLFNIVYFEHYVQTPRWYSALCPAFAWLLAVWALAKTVYSSECFSNRGEDGCAAKAALNDRSSSLGKGAILSFINAFWAIMLIGQYGPIIIWFHCTALVFRSYYEYHRILCCYLDKILRPADLACSILIPFFNCGKS